MTSSYEFLTQPKPHANRLSFIPGVEHRCIFYGSGDQSVIRLHTKRHYLCVYVYIKSQKQSLTLSNPLGSCSKFSNFRASRPLPSNSPSNFTLKCCSNFSSSSIFTFSIFWSIRGQLGPIKGSKYRFRALRLLPSDLPSNFT